jgi:signal peptide peptidase SppA
METETETEAKKHKPANDVIQAIAATPWAITENGLETVMAVAQRRMSDYEAVLLKSAERAESGKLYMRDGVAILNVTGTIFPRANFFTNFSGGTTVENLALGFGKALNDVNVKAIILNIDSPGGQITGVHELANMIYNARGRKPVHAYVSALGASAAYWIATAAESVVCDETAFVGSIGVVAAWTDDTEKTKSNGVKKYQVVSSQSPNKRLDPASDEGRKQLQRELDALAEVFISDIARNRNASAETVREKFGKGGLVIAGEAIGYGMADKLGSLEGLISDLKNVSFTRMEISSMDDKKETVSEPEKEGAFFSNENLDKNANGNDDLQSHDGKASGRANAAADQITEAKLLAANPELYNDLIQKGVLQERERIKSIDAMNVVIDNKSLLDEAKFGKPCSAEELAYKIVQAESKAGRSFSANFTDDKKELENVSGSVETKDNDFDSDVKGIAAAFSAGVNSKCKL